MSLKQRVTPQPMSGKLTPTTNGGLSGHERQPNGCRLFMLNEDVAGELAC